METPERNREYSRTKDRLALIGMALSVLTSSSFVFTGMAGRVGTWLAPGNQPGLGRRLGYAMALSAISTLSSLPLSFYSSYVVEKRFGLSKQTVPGWLGDAMKARAISLPIELAVTEGVFAAIRRFPKRWWLVCAGAVVPLSAVFAQLFPVLIAPRFNRYEPLQDRQLAERLKDLTGRAGVPVADVMQMDMSRRTTKANAFFAGVGRTKRIVLADTMLETFTLEEIEGVVAHETAHQVNKDIWRFIALSGVGTLLTAWIVDAIARRLLRTLPYLARTRDLANPRSLPVIGVVLTIVGILLSPLQLGYSRRVERRADRYAIELTGNPAAYARAMRKLAEQNLADPNPPRPITLLLHSHPPLSERIAVAEAAEYNLVEGVG